MNTQLLDYVINNIAENDIPKFISYALYFNFDAGKELAEGLHLTNINMWEPNAVDDVLDPIFFFQKYQFSIEDILLSDAWNKFLMSTITEDGVAMVRAMKEFGHPKNIMLLIRACYRYGHPIMEDYVYDVILDLYTSTFQNLAFLKEQAYDDDIYDGVLSALLEIYNIIPNETQSQEYIEYRDMLDQEKSTSIRPVEEVEEVFNFLKTGQYDKVLFSLKMDGVNTKKCYKDGKFLVGLSRGRSSKSLDYTNTLKSIVPETIDTNSSVIKITSEALVDDAYLDVLRTKYPDKNFKTSKSSAMSMLRAYDSYATEDFKHLKIYSFDGEGIGANKIEIYNNLEKLGFTTPYHFVINRMEIPDDINLFEEWLTDNIIEPMFKKQNELNVSADGVVCEKIGIELSDRKDQYSDSSIAIKFSHWAATTYTSIVKNIIVEQKRINASIVLEIEPVITHDGNTATRVSGGSLALLIANNISIGSKIQFRRKSSAYNVLVL